MAPPINKQKKNFIYVTPDLLIFKTHFLSHFMLLIFITETLINVQASVESLSDFSDNMTRGGICCQYLPKQRFRFSIYISLLIDVDWLSSEINNYVHMRQFIITGHF